MQKQSRKLDLDLLKEGLPGISAARGMFYREAVIVGLKKQGHQSGILMEISGAFQEKFEVVWEDDIDILTVNSWRDELQIANFGAVGIALLLMKSLLEIISFEEGVIGTGIDFWVSTKDYLKAQIPFMEREARLEISGILEEKPSNTVNMRIGKKRKQMHPTDHLELTGWIIVVEFKTPKSKIEKK